jgi:hypothetical protein
MQGEEVMNNLREFLHRLTDSYKFLAGILPHKLICPKYRLFIVIRFILALSARLNL